MLLRNTDIKIDKLTQRPYLLYDALGIRNIKICQQIIIGISFIVFINVIVWKYSQVRQIICQSKALLK